MSFTIADNRRMPNKVELGQPRASTMGAPMMQLSTWQRQPPSAGRYVMGFRLPEWQRGLVWTKRQKISFIESAWRGVPLGTYSFNRAPLGSPLDDLLIDGQQRMNAIECYLRDEFAVFGWRWSEVTEVDQRVWEMAILFESYVTATEDEDYLRSYYDLLNFGGTPHRKSERASNGPN